MRRQIGVDKSCDSLRFSCQRIPTDDSDILRHFWISTLQDTVC